MAAWDRLIASLERGVTIGISDAEPAKRNRVAPRAKCAVRQGALPSERSLASELTCGRASGRWRGPAVPDAATAHVEPPTKWV
jgi:hypothetical protein